LVKDEKHYEQRGSFLLSMEKEIKHSRNTFKTRKRLQWMDQHSVNL